MQQLECVSFILSWSDILKAGDPLPYEGIRGKSDAKRTDITWNNFNIGEMLKDYGDYEYFNLRLYDVMLQNSGSWATTANGIVKYMLSGFDFVHQSYDVQTQSELLEVPLCSVVESSEMNMAFQNLNHTIRFKKGLSNNIITLRARVVRTVDDNSNENATITGVHPRIHMIFNIFPIE